MQRKSSFTTGWKKSEWRRVFLARPAPGGRLGCVPQPEARPEASLSLVERRAFRARRQAVTPAFSMHRSESRGCEAVSVEVASASGGSLLARTTNHPKRGSTHTHTHTHTHTQATFQAFGCDRIASDRKNFLSYCTDCSTGGLGPHTR